MRITHHEVNYIMRRTKPHNFERLFCYWTIQKENNNSGWLRCYMKWWAYILLFIPVHILKLFMCMWDGGIKEFYFEPRRMNSYGITGLTSDDARTEFGRFKSVWEKNNEEDDWVRRMIND